MTEPTITDCIEKAISLATGIACTYVDVTETVRELERRHLSGPTAARVLGEGVAGVALLSTVLARPEERLSLQLGCDGPVGGVMAEATGDGTLRGFTYFKVLNELDGDPHADLARAMGRRGLMQVIRSNTEKTLSSGQINATPPAVRHAIARYLIESQQQPAAIAFHVSTHEGYLACARGLLCERMPDGKPETFVPILERFERGDMAQALATARGIDDLRTMFGLPDLAVRERKALRFECRCSYEKTLAMLAVFSPEELRSMIDEGEYQTVTCHFCGESYRIPAQEIETILALKSTSS